MPTLKIDGREVTVERGTTILDAARKVGIDIPTFCYHPGLTKPANCRMCLVDTNKAPKPTPACYAECMDDMEVSTQSPEIVKTRKAVLEFILLNHPVDCPICDQAGECVLQDHYFKYSATPSRLAHKKVHKPKVKRLGPDVVLDAERCILCTRCIRFCDEVAKETQLEIVNRGEHSEITTFPGKQLDNPYAGNTVDICPVGALTSVDFRFRTRVWMLQSSDGVCPECSRGCKTRTDVFENVPRRTKPLHNPRVNDWWMCDEGRLAYRDYQALPRMEGPAAQVEGKRRVVTNVEAIEAAALELGAVAQRQKIGVVATPWFTNEDAWLVAELLRGPLAGARIYLGGRADGTADEILRKADKNPNRAGVEAIFEAAGLKAAPLSALDTAGLEALLVFGDQHALDEAGLEKLERVPRRVVVSAFQTPLWKMATTFLPARTHFEKVGTFTNFEGMVQRLEQAVNAAASCKSYGYYAMKLAELMGHTISFVRPEDVFAEVARTVPGFAGMTWQGLAPYGMKLGEGVAPAEPPTLPQAAPPAAPTEA
ncbi:MAG: (2Fe-2S)-binding protein [Deltaproteobacteria bacterium]|nr:(2Fe-2S)-binding protein [Deltaproteobacteria bacterium]